MLKKQHHGAHLSRRERQIMDLLYRHNRLPAAEVHQRLPDPPSYSAVRATLRILEEKGHIRHQTDGTRYVYFPAHSRERASRSAAAHLLDTFFQGSAVQAVAALLDVSSSRLTDSDLNRLAEIVETARKEGK
jgi:BlaI family transcriptional regulator, penicillinase repressor